MVATLITRMNHQSTVAHKRPCFVQQQSLLRCFFPSLGHSLCSPSSSLLMGSSNSKPKREAPSPVKVQSSNTSNQVPGPQPSAIPSMDGEVSRPKALTFNEPVAAQNGKKKLPGAAASHRPPKPGPREQKTIESIVKVRRLGAIQAAMHIDLTSNFSTVRDVI